MADRFPLMVFAAGLGTRMRHLTQVRPKPLIPVAGVPMLDRALAFGRAARCRPVVVNTHYLSEQMVTHLMGRRVKISHEKELLETGGGLKQALPMLGHGAVMTLNPDVIWTGGNPLKALSRAWDPLKMGALLLLAPRSGLPGRKGGSDFTLGPDGRIQRMPKDSETGEDMMPGGMVYLGAQILRTDWLFRTPERVFSLNLAWDDMIRNDRAYGLIWGGGWCDVGSPEGLAEAEALLAK
ncbi:nucleotidyltransferase family protein [Pseudogemmobacter bohemicus]|uniref:nucleotidyltransferase family protein n=1 Tax=Pseudogemmobacter bohemicus TaxID=2250708 RepID=UPI000DD37938|nr:nucleotidyltransferase family protein [Pseudogemmobacter bohemicus]